MHSKVFLSTILALITQVSADWNADMTALNANWQFVRLPASAMFVNRTKRIPFITEKFNTAIIECINEHELTVNESRNTGCIMYAKCFGKPLATGETAAQRKATCYAVPKINDLVNDNSAFTDETATNGAAWQAKKRACFVNNQKTVDFHRNMGCGLHATCMGAGTYADNPLNAKTNMCYGLASVKRWLGVSTYNAYRYKMAVSMYSQKHPANSNFDDFNEAKLTCYNENQATAESHRDAACSSFANCVGTELNDPVVKANCYANQVTPNGQLVSARLAITYLTYNSTQSALYNTIKYNCYIENQSTVTTYRNSGCELFATCFGNESPFDRPRYDYCYKQNPIRDRLAITTHCADVGVNTNACRIGTLSFQDPNYTTTVALVKRSNFAKRQEMADPTQQIVSLPPPGTPDYTYGNPGKYTDLLSLVTINNVSTEYSTLCAQTNWAYPCPSQNFNEAY